MAVGSWHRVLAPRSPHACVRADVSTGFEDPLSVGTDINAHGTAVAGIIAATCNNQIGICGIAPRAKTSFRKGRELTDGQFQAASAALGAPTPPREGAFRHSVRKKFGRHAPNPLNQIGTATSPAESHASGSGWVRSGGAVRLTSEKSLLGLEVARTEPGSPSY